VKFTSLWFAYPAGSITRISFGLGPINSNALEFTVSIETEWVASLDCGHATLPPKAVTVGIVDVHGAIPGCRSSTHIALDLPC
jgi:hypothetical protein